MKQVTIISNLLILSTYFPISDLFLSFFETLLCQYYWILKLKAVH